MKHTSQFIHARLVLMISTIELLRSICSYLSLVGLAWTSWNQWPHPQRCAAPFFRLIHIIKVLSSSPAHTCTYQKMKIDRCNTTFYWPAFPGLPYSNLYPLINLLLLNIASLGTMSSFCLVATFLQLAISQDKHTHVTNFVSRSFHHSL